MRRLLSLLLQLLRAIGLMIGRVNNFLLLLLSFYLLLLPIGVLRRLLSRKPPRPGWIDRAPLKRDHFEKQY